MVDCDDDDDMPNKAKHLFLQLRSVEPRPSNVPILSLALHNAQPPHGAFIGRNHSEDKSLNPKRVVALLPGVQRAVPWATISISSMPETRPAAAIDGLIFALLLDEPAPTKWFLKLNLL
ncbi:uncharacterized protein LACBIDRAFT_332261 [Laccaria bicolor S238N-H82]|uniref:Predicted protein n=1 Tax=Laccaria bicolor (strain S238N-H82 / ATCC MYA-4686) TaxID=486041 RepID=B0DS47_LACBS|nr:uncharacterized protein LACBIDRAFT_332261 [Laccaria bicolor S238N-H82]EDR02728.1 predicted protein [Laccaria bicolor S238N-H82]|eukprot:XP_001886772.1 predicted protein [Laccaria bicolor S238N-H82]